VRSTFKCLLAGCLVCAACGPISKLPPLASKAVEAERHNQQIEQIRDYFAKRGRLHSVAFRIRAPTVVEIGLEEGDY
jgi:hypothetical protein